MQNNDEAVLTAANPRTWILNLSSLMFIVLQSACTAVMAISGLRVLIGVGALAAATELHRPSTGFHANVIRVPMMIVAVAGSLINLYVLWRMRSLRARPASQWRMQPVSRKQKREEMIQFVLAILTLILVIAEESAHYYMHYR